MTDSRPQSEGFSFYRVPRQLVKGREFRPLSPAGKLLFALLLDRVSLSVKNSWRDREGRTYVYLRRRGDLRGFRLQPCDCRKAALGAGADRPDQA